MKRLATAVFAVLLSTVAFGQDPKPAVATAPDKTAAATPQDKPAATATAPDTTVQQLTDAQELSVRVPENDAKDSLAKLDKQALQDYLTAQSDLQKAVQAIYAARNTTSREYTLCEGANPPLCVGAPAHKLSLIKVPPQPSAQPETKK